MRAQFTQGPVSSGWTLVLLLITVCRYISLTPWTWATTVVVEALVKFSVFNNNSPVVDFGLISVGNAGESSSMRLVQHGGNELTTSSFDQHEWTHLVAMFHDNTLTVFKNGIKDGEAAVDSVLPRHAAPTVLLGKAVSPESSNFQGVLAFVNFYHRPVSTSEVSAMFAEISPTCNPGFGPAGTLPGPTLPSCAPCESGKASSTEDRAPCSICSAGSFSGVGAVACEKCPAGTFLEDEGTDALLHDHLDDCSSCVAGKANGIDGANECMDCTGGKYSSFGAVECSGTPHGYTSDNGVLSPCPPSTYNEGIINECDSCVAGYFCPGGSGKIPCGTAGLYAPSGATMFSTAAPGYYTTPLDSDHNVRTGQAVCEPGFACVGGERNLCDSDQFQPQSGQTKCYSCQFCGSGTRTVSPCSVLKDRVCEDCHAGKWGDGVSCHDCELGKFSSTKAAFCATAPAGHRSIDANTAVEKCPADTFSMGAADTCATCPETGFSAAGSSTCDSCGPGKFKLVDGGITTCESCAAGRYERN
jgi:hypothetical protein